MVSSNHRVLQWHIYRIPWSYLQMQHLRNTPAAQPVWTSEIDWTGCSHHTTQSCTHIFSWLNNGLDQKTSEFGQARKKDSQEVGGRFTTFTRSSCPSWWRTWRYSCDRVRRTNLRKIRKIRKIRKTGSRIHGPAAVSPVIPLTYIQPTLLSAVNRSLCPEVVIIVM